MSIQTLQNAVKNAVNRRIENEARILRGTLANGKLQIGNEQLEPVQAVDCNVDEGKRVWALRTNNGKAVIVGA